MSVSDIIWAFGPLAILWVALMVFRSRRRRTTNYAESALVKSRLPGWVRQVEALLFCAGMLGGVIGLAWLCFRVAGGPFSVAVSQGPGAVLGALSSALIAIPLAGLFVNLVSWLTPPLRLANERAMSGTNVSYRSQTVELAYFGAVALAIALALLAIAVLASKFSS